MKRTRSLPTRVGSDGQHLRGRVHGGDVCCVAEKLAGPCSAPAGELKHAAGRAEGIQRCGQLLTARGGPGNGRNTRRRWPGSR